MSLSSGVGLVSGLNFNDIISKLLSLNARPLQVMQNRQGLLGKRQEALQSINKAVLTLKDSLGNLNQESDFNRRTITVGNKDLLSATATNTAAEGTYSVAVTQLATNHRLASQGVANSDQIAIAAANGVFSFQLGTGAVKSYSVTASTTLAQLRDAINADSASGVRASIINNGGDTNPYQLVLTSTNTGEDNVVKCGDDERDAWMQVDPETFFTTEHYHGYPSVLVRLESVELDALREVIEQAWRLNAPKRLIAEREGHGKKPRAKK